EFNIEGYPSDKCIDLVLSVKPGQVTLVPDPPGTLTSNEGWEIVPNMTFLQGIIKKFQKAGIRTSIFIETDLENMRAARDTGTNRVELYTEPYASRYHDHPDEAIEPFVKAAEVAQEVGLGINAGHDLNLHNLRFFKQNIPGLLEVSIGHALIADAIYFGLETTIKKYLTELKI
ncbi:MAG: pyridoxine 5'-phosphate synthase, partial [Bacteroidota bacterium]